MADLPIMYGIPNCNTIKKARSWLEEHGIEYQFHDYKKAGTDAAQLKGWIDEFGWKQVVNTRGMTWRKLEDETKAAMDEQGAINIMMEKPSIIKRPIVVKAEQTLIGFDESQYSALFL